MALATAAITGTSGTSPTPFTPCGCFGFGTSTNASAVRTAGRLPSLRKRPRRGGPIGAGVQLTTKARRRLGTHICDVEGDVELGNCARHPYTRRCRMSPAPHPGYVEGQMQGGVAQGIGWALNGGYIYTKDGKSINRASRLSMPVCRPADARTVMVEVPNPKHPQGVKGVGEVPLVPVMAAVAQRHPQRAGKNASTACRCRRRSIGRA